MSVSAGKVHLVQVQPLGAQARTGGGQGKRFVIAAGQVALGVLDLLLARDRSREELRNWARAERVTWYPGCGW